MSSKEFDFASKRVWAVVGASENPEKYGNKIFRQLKAANYKVYPIHPKLSELDGVPCFPSLDKLPEVPEVVNMVIPPSAAEPVIDDCIRLGIKRLWFQPGSESAALIQKAEAAGIEVLANACILLQYQEWD